MEQAVVYDGIATGKNKIPCHFLCHFTEHKSNTYSLIFSPTILRFK
jgi:hypothetical protein